MNYSRNHIFWGAVLAFLFGLGILNYHKKVYAYNLSFAQKKADASFSIMTFNVSASDSSIFTDSFQHKLLNIIFKENPDIVCFQELSFNNLRKIKPQLDSIYGPGSHLKGESQMWRLYLYSHFPIRDLYRCYCIGDIQTDDMTEEEMGEVDLIQQRMGIMTAAFEVEPDHWVTFYAGHLRSSAYSTARRSMNEESNWLDGLSLYKRNYRIGKRIRDYEAQNIRRYVDENRTEGNPVIIAGDLNDWCGSDCLNTLMGDDLKDAWWEGGNGFGWTYFGWHLRLRLDHILYSDELEIVDVEVVDSDLSDHKPLLARFKIK